MEDQAPEMPQEQEAAPEEHQAPPALVVPLASLGMDATMVKPGQVLELQVSAVHGDMVELTPMQDDEQQDPEMPSDDEAKNMPMDELESKLPKAER